MRDDKRKERLAALFGLELPPEPTAAEKEAAQTVSREAEAVILYVEDSKRFIERMCKWCEAPFAVNRGNIAFCSDACRGKHLHELGLEWDPTSRTLAERWSPQTGGPEPLLVPPTVLALLPRESADELAG